MWGRLTGPPRFVAGSCASGHPGIACLLLEVIWDVPSAAACGLHRPAYDDPGSAGGYHPAAEIDVANARYAGEQLAAACVSGAGTVIADLTLTRFCDVAGAVMLAEVQRYAGQLGIELRLAMPGTAVRRLLALAGVDRSLRIYATLDDALAGVSTPPDPGDKAL